MAVLAAILALLLSPQAQLGRRLFFDPALSASGTVSCASCHDPDHAYAAPPSTPLAMRAVPSLRYLADTPRFSRHSYVDRGSEREDLGPSGGFMRDGRADSLHEQTLLPLLDPTEMANTNIEAIATLLRARSYDRQLAATASTPRELVVAAAGALERFELEDPSFHPYSSRFDRYLRGESTLSAQELEGMRLFISPVKGNCAACHTATTGPGGTPPVFTDFSYHALGVPRNPANSHRLDVFDLGLCGPRRTDMRTEHRYCGYFKTPTLRNVTTRSVFFHNGRFTTLRDVLHFYVERDTNPERWYPKSQRFDDLPARYRGNVNTSDAPFNRERGDAPALNDSEIEKIIAFLATLNDSTAP